MKPIPTSLQPPSAIRPPTDAPTKRNYDSLQAGRAIAAIIVVLFHLGGCLAAPRYFDMPWLSLPFRWGDAGVEFFFVLSGFIISLAHWRDVSRPERCPAYLWRRTARIYPPYWFVFAAVCLASAVVPGLGQAMPSAPSTLVKSLLLLPQDAAVVGGTGAPVVIVAWTLQYEIVFYLLFAILILDVRLGLGVIVAYALYALVSVGTTAASFPSSFLLRPYFWLFGLGILANRSLPNHSDQARGWRTELFVGIASLLVWAMNRAYRFVELGDIDTYAIGIASALIIHATARGESAGVDLSGGRVLQCLGSASYALYLIHYPLISAMSKVASMLHVQSLGIWAVGLSAISIFLTTVIAATAFHLAIEAPVHRWLSSLSRRDH